MITPKQLCLLGAVSAAQKEAESKQIKQAQFTQKLSPRQALALTILFNSPEGVLSHDLRRELKTNNIAQYVRSLRQKNVRIKTEREEYCDEDGEENNVGRYVLLSRQRAIELLGWV